MTSGSSERTLARGKRIQWVSPVSEGHARIATDSDDSAGS